MEKPRHLDGRTTPPDLAEPILVRCRSCSECSRLGRGATKGEWRETCAHCGFSRLWPPGDRGTLVWPGPGPRLAGFGLELFLQEACRGQVLWAYNEGHLCELEAYVRAELRERRRDERWGWANGSLASRLPRWIKASENREAVMRAVKALRDRLPD